ncbi:hypothetical protein [Mariprofundus ferrooxydans]|uniref:hypothetical protein n=1 Tax=Mariprofundus ferrooxydans TaxID=314344 RepID=UPI00142F76B5|nr:hypothetical protein [Mariprofundus ferrooxydans]
MILVAGILSVIQAVLLPGFAATFVVKDIRLVDRVLLSLPLSLSLNYVLVLFLVAIDSYNYRILYLIFVIEVAVLLIILLRFKGEGSCSRINIQWSYFSQGSLGNLLIGLLIFIFSTSLLYQIWFQSGTVFTKWDAVVSWNRWAVSWYNLQLPLDSWTYPQALPILYSLSYAFIDDVRVQLFAKFIAILFPLAALVTLFRIAGLSEKYRKYVFLTIPIFIYLLGKTGGEYYGIQLIVSGYADGAMAYYGVLACYVFILLSQESGANVSGMWTNRILVLATIAIAGAAVTKQPAVLLAGLFPFVWYYYIGQREGKGGVVRTVWLCLILFLFITPWYIYKLFEVYSGHESLAIGTYNSAISVVWYLRPLHAVQMFFDGYGWVWFPVLALGLRNPLARKLAILVVLPVFMLWAFVVSYDLRSLSLALPSVAFIFATGCYEFWGIARNYIAGRFAFVAWLALLLASNFMDIPTLMAWPNSVPKKFFVVIFIALISAGMLFWFCQKWRVSQRAIILLTISVMIIFITGMSFILPTGINEKIIARSIYLQQKIGSSDVNDYLLKYFSDHNYSETLASNYLFLGFIPGLKERYMYANCGVMNPAVRYYLWSPDCTDKEMTNFENKVGAGNFSKKMISPNFFFYEIRNYQSEGKVGTESD